MSIRDKAKKVGKAAVFVTLFEEINANKEPIAEDMAKIKEHIQEWAAEAPKDLNAVLASILVKAKEGSVEDAKAEVEAAKAKYQAVDEDVIPWFESQIEIIEAEKAAEDEVTEE